VIAWNIAGYLASAFLFKSLRLGGFYPIHAPRLLTRPSSRDDAEQWGPVSPLRPVASDGFADFKAAAVP